MISITYTMSEKKLKWFKNVKRYELKTKSVM